VVSRRELLLLTAHPELHAPRRLTEAAASRELEVAFVRPEAADLVARELAARHSRSDRPLLLARPGTFSFRPVLAAWRRLVEAGAIPLQSRRALRIACDQWLTLATAARAGVPFPPTRLVRRPAELDDALAAVGGPPWYLKGRRGSQGTHVERTTEHAAALRIGLRYWGSGQSVLVQADRSTRGPIERHLVAGGRLLLSVRAEPRPGEHRSNAHRGGRFVPLSAEQATAARLARCAVAAVGLPFAAVDAIGGPRPELLEVNASPGLEAIERATGRDLAGELLDALLPWCGLERPPARANFARELP
jgi:ribosomal protein S6--L-glutamate ligase